MLKIRRLKFITKASLQPLRQTFRSFHLAVNSNAKLVQFSNEAQLQDNGVIDFGRGFQAAEDLPVELFRKATTHALSKNLPKYLKYGGERGPKEFLSELAKFLDTTTGYAASEPSYKVLPEQLMVSHGASQGMQMVCQAFSVPGDTIIVESPTYFLAKGVFKGDHRLNTVESPIDEHGLIIDSHFEELCVKHKPKLLYTIPIHHNPSGATLSYERRLELLKLARKYNFIVLADEVYQMIHFKDYTPPPSMVAVDDENDPKVISLGSFAKIMSPGLRLGWIQSKNKGFLENLSTSGVLLSGGSSHFVASIMHSALELGLQAEQLQRYNAIYEERTRTGCRLLKKYFGEDSKFPLLFHETNGGYFVWAKIANESITADELLEVCQEHQVVFKPGKYFSSDKEHEYYIRFCFVYWTPQRIEEGMKNLLAAVNHAQQRSL